MYLFIFAYIFIGQFYVPTFERSAKRSSVPGTVAMYLNIPVLIFFLFVLYLSVFISCINVKSIKQMICFG
jgi:hypothetical protein